MITVADALSMALLHFIWQGTAVGVVWSLLMRVLAKSSANSRYLVSCIVLAALALAPVITFAFEWHTADVPMQTSVDTFRSSTFSPGPEHITLPQTLGVSLESWILPLWAAGVLVFTLRLAWAGGHASSLRRRGTKAEPPLESIMAGLAERLGVRQKLLVLMSSVAEVPSVVGWIRPVILLPAAVVTGLTRQQLESLLAHELAHIRRYDYFVNILQMVIETFLFYHPAVWLVSERIRDERELCCDDLAVRSCGDALSYARALAQLEKLRAPATSLVMGSTNGPVYNRIQRLLVKGKYEHVPSRLACAAGLLTGLLCLGWFMTARAQQREALPSVEQLAPLLEQAPPIPARPALPRSAPVASAQPAAPAVAAPAPVLQQLAAPALASPQLAAPGLASPQLAAPALALPQLAAPALASPQLAAPGLALPQLAAPALTSPQASAPALPVAPAPPASPALVPLRAQPVPPTSPMAILPLLQALVVNESHWVLFRGDSVITRATAADEERAKKARGTLAGDLLWFQLDGKGYITQDQHLMDAIQGESSQSPGINRLQQLVDQAAEQSRVEAKRRAVQAEAQSTLEQARRSFGDSVRGDAVAQQAELETIRVRLEVLSAEIQAIDARRQEVLRTMQSQLEAARRDGELGASGEIEILRGAVRDGKAQMVP